jgi:hypothetical protein
MKNSKVLTDARRLLDQLQATPTQRPDLSVLTDDELRAILAMQERLEAAGLPLVPGSLTGDELAVYESIERKLIHE